MTVKAYIDEGVEALAPLYAREEAKALLGIVLEEFCGYPSHIYYIDPDRLLPAACLPGVQRALDDLRKARPIQYILGEVLFEGCTIKVREGVLIPRPETAEWVRWAQAVVTAQWGEQASLRILDMCTGSGAIAVALAKAFPQAEVYGMDISEQALEAAMENSLLNKAGVHFFKADILQAPDLSALPLLPYSLDLLIGNPPYVRMSEQARMHPNVLNYEPHTALFVPDGDPLLFYRALADWGTTLLKAGGRLMAEVNEQMGVAFQALLIDRGYMSVQLRRDFNGKTRMVAAEKMPTFAVPVVH